MVSGLSWSRRHLYSVTRTACFFRLPVSSTTPRSQERTAQDLYIELYSITTATYVEKSGDKFVIASDKFMVLAIFCHHVHRGRRNSLRNILNHRKPMLDDNTTDSAPCLQTVLTLPSTSRLTLILRLQLKS